MLVQLHQYSLWLTPMYLMSFCERYALNSSNLDHYSTEQSSVALGQRIDWDSEKFRSHMDVIQCFLYGHFYSCLALQIVSMEEWCYSAIKEHIWNIPTIFILQNVFTSKWFLDILTICMQICLTTYVAKTEKKQIHFCFPKWADIFTEKKITCTVLFALKMLVHHSACMIFWPQPTSIYWWVSVWLRISSAFSVEIPQTCTNPLTYWWGNAKKPQLLFLMNMSCLFLHNRMCMQ